MTLSPGLKWKLSVLESLFSVLEASLLWERLRSSRPSIFSDFVLFCNMNSFRYSNKFKLQLSFEEPMEEDAVGSDVSLEWMTIRKRDL